MSKLGTPAFPNSWKTFEKRYREQCPYTITVHNSQSGMMLWDYFAAAALSACKRIANGNDMNVENVAANAALIADQMLEERAKRLKDTK